MKRQRPKKPPNPFFVSFETADETDLSKTLSQLEKHAVSNETRAWNKDYQRSLFQGVSFHPSLPGLPK
jgi:hypothetical protein